MGIWDKLFGVKPAVKEALEEHQVLAGSVKKDQYRTNKAKPILGVIRTLYEYVDHGAPHWAFTYTTGEYYVRHLLDSDLLDTWPDVIDKDDVWEAQKHYYTAMRNR